MSRYLGQAENLSELQTWLVRRGAQTYFLNNNTNNNINVYLSE